MQFTLNITIDDTGLTSIYDAGQSVIIAQSVSSIAMTATMPTSGGGLVAWLAFQPLENNQVTWTSSYLLYATTTPLDLGAELVMNSSTTSAAQLGWLYTFENGYFSGASDVGDTYNVLNEDSTYSFGFGLAAQATVNGTTVTAPTSVLEVLFSEEANFEPTGDVLVFLSSVSSNGTFLGSTPTNALTVTFTTEAPTANIGFNDSTNEFYLISQS